MRACGDSCCTAFNNTGCSDPPSLYLVHHGNPKEHSCASQESALVPESIDCVSHQTSPPRRSHSLLKFQMGKLKIHTVGVTAGDTSVPTESTDCSSAGLGATPVLPQGTIQKAQDPCRGCHHRRGTCSDGMHGFFHDGSCGHKGLSAALTHRPQLTERIVGLFSAIATSAFRATGMHQARIESRRGEGKTRGSNRTPSRSTQFGPVPLVRLPVLQFRHSSPSCSIPSLRSRCPRLALALMTPSDSVMAQSLHNDFCARVDEVRRRPVLLSLRK